MSKKTNKVEPLWQWPGTKKSLELEEWWFEDCPDDELHFCWAYEYGRHIDAILMEHSKDEENDFRYGDEDILENGIWSSSYGKASGTSRLKKSSAFHFNNLSVPLMDFSHVERMGAKRQGGYLTLLA